MRLLTASKKATFPGIPGPGLTDRERQAAPAFLKRFYVNSEDIRFLDHQATALSDGDEVSIVRRWPEAGNPAGSGRSNLHGQVT